jgi:hypothetical protein
VYLVDISGIYKIHTQHTFNTYGRHMVLKRQVEIPKEEEPKKDVEKAREQFIRGGGLVPSDIKKEESDEWTKISLRIKVEAISKIDERISKKMGMNRTGWILQAIEEQFKKEI